MSPFGSMLLRARHAGVAVWVAMVAPVLTTALSLSMEVTNWSVVQVDVQRAADAAAIAGALNYKATSNRQTAATAAARMAQLNGAQGMTTPTWTAATSTLSDNMVTAQVTTGVKSNTDTAIKVTVQQSVPLTVSQLFSNASSVTVTGAAMAELVASTGPGTGGQPCLVALSTSGSISGSGSTYITMPNCTIRSNGTISVNGGGSISTGGIYAGGAISIQPGVTTTGTQHPSDGTISDPYRTNTTLQTALTNAASASGSNITCGNESCGLPGSSGGTYNGSYCTGQGGSGPVNCYLRPGNYGSLGTGGGGPFNFNFAAGLYVFNGAITLTNATTTSSGTNVTILTTGTFSGGSTFSMTLSAPSTTAVASTGGIAGIALAGTTSGTVSVYGTDTFNITGVVYFPNALFDASGSSGLGVAATSCLEILASSIQLTGHSYFDHACSAVNAASFTSVAGVTTTNASIVQ